MLMKAALFAALVLTVLPAAGESDWCGSLYTRKCASCHGTDGSGHSYLGTKLRVGDMRSKFESLSDQQIAEVILHGRGKMPANPRLSTDQVEGLTVYLRALAAGGVQTSAICAAPSDSTADLYGTHCASCHARNGTGNGVLGKSLKVPDLTSPVVQNASDEKLGAVITAGRGKMSGYGNVLIPEQVAELVAYLRTLKPSVETAESAPVEKRAQAATHAASSAKSASTPSASAAASGKSKSEAVTAPWSKSERPKEPTAMQLPKAETAQKAKTDAANQTAAVGKAMPAAKTQEHSQDELASVEQPDTAPAATAGAEKTQGTPPLTYTPPTTKAARPLTYTPPKRPPDMHEIYARKCSACHSRDGSGSGIVGRQMRIRSFSSPDVRAASDEQLASVISNGRGKMPAYGKKLTSEQLRLLVDYVRQLQSVEQ